MNKDQVWQLVNLLQPGENLIITSDKEIKIQRSNNNGKKYKIYAGKIEEFPEIIIPLPNKPFAKPPTKGKRSFYKFGVILPKRIAKTENNKKAAKWAQEFILLREMGLEIKEGFYTCSQLAIKYETKTIGDITVYYYQGNPRKIQFKNERIEIPRWRDTMNTEYFSSLEEVK
jgi:hypothetical protein